MNQSVVSSRFPYLPIHLAVGQRSEALEALLDTGFDGDVAVPADPVSTGHPPSGYSRWILADGSTVFAPLFRGTIHVGPLGPFDALITALGDEPIVGRGVTDRFKVTLDHGQQVIVDP